MTAFLSDEWFAEFAAMRAAAGDLEIAPKLAALKLNLVVSDTAQGDVDVCLNGGILTPGHDAGAVATMTMPADLARRILLKWDQAAGMSGMLARKIKVEGDKMKLMAMQSTRLSPQHKALLAQIDDRTA